MQPPGEAPAWIPEHALARHALVDPVPPDVAETIGTELAGVADLREPVLRPKRVGTTRVVLDDELNPFERLSADGRKRLLVRVLCGLVAYDTEADAEVAATDLLAG